MKRVFTLLLLLSSLMLSAQPERIYNLYDFDEVLQNADMVYQLEISRSGYKLNGDYQLLNKLPEQITQLAKLEILHIRGTDLESLSGILTELTQLKELYIIKNRRLEQLPDDFGNLQSLEKISLYFNNLKTLPESIVTLPNLQSLDIRTNRLETLPEGLINMASLKELRAETNKLSEADMKAIYSKFPTEQPITTTQPKPKPQDITPEPALDMTTAVSAEQKNVEDTPISTNLVERMPFFPGCEDLDINDEEYKICADTKMLEYVYKNLQYPPEAREQRVQGTCVVKFIIELDGTISDITLVKDIGAGCGEAALEVVKSMKERDIRWTPGMQRGQEVRVLFNLPVKFRLE